VAASDGLRQKGGLGVEKVIYFFSSFFKVDLMFKLAERSGIKDCHSGPRVVFHFILMVMFCLR